MERPLEGNPILFVGGPAHGTLMVPNNGFPRIFRWAVGPNWTDRDWTVTSAEYELRCVQIRVGQLDLEGWYYGYAKTPASDTHRQAIGLMIAGALA